MPRLSKQKTAAVAATAIAAALLGASAPSSGQDDARTAAAASASAYTRADEDGRSGYVRVSGDGSESKRGASVRASTAGGTGSARATASVKRVDIFSGLVTAERVSVAVSAGGGSARTSGSVRGLQIGGENRRVPRGGRSFDMNGYGRLVALRRSGGAIVGLRARLTQDYEGHDAGDTVSVAYAAAKATDSEAPPEEERDEPSREKKDDRAEPDKPDKETPRERARRRREARVKELREGSYTFPVFGEHRFTDDWGAPRQFTGTHVGNDIFAEAGTPLVAVADGKLFRVGTRRISGNRLWLQSKRGDNFFYAHLSSFAESARNGAQVKAGDIIGYMGSTGDAEQTPPHLHFEVHPGGGDPVNPSPILRAWAKMTDVPDAAARPGALVVVEDYLEAR